MTRPHTIIIQKGSDSVVDLLNEFGVACTSFPFEVGGETKELEVRDWLGEDGEDAYLPPSGLPLKAYDVEAEMSYKGRVGSMLANIMAMRDYLSGADGDGASLKIYNPQTGIGRRDCYFKQLGEPEATYSDVDEVLTFKLTFRVQDPVTQIEPTYNNAETEIISLGDE